MPDLLFHYLTSGHCGESNHLPGSVADLVRMGVVDREALLEHVLGLLTAPQRPMSQKVLAGIVEALGMRAREVHGGLSFLLGVIATSTGAVGSTLLPHALELVADADGLLELTTVIVGRPEKQQRVALLAGLRRPELLVRVGSGPVVEALGVLGSGDDAAFADKVRRVAAEVPADGHDTGRQADSPACTGIGGGAHVPMGLWDLPPVPSGVDHRPYWWRRDRRPSWRNYLDSLFHHYDLEQPWLVDLTLTAMVADTFDGAAMVRDAAAHLLGVGRLSMSRLPGTLSDLFLGGGLRQGWPTAMSVADVACGAPRRPAGLPELLRMLATYAAQVPPPSQGSAPLPPHVAELAAADGRTKAQMEARRLGAALARVEVDTLVAQLKASGPAIDRPEIRGLWNVVPAAPDPLPSEVRLEDLALDLTDLRSALEADFNHYAQSHGDVSFWGTGYSELSPATNLTYPDRILAATVRAIHVLGAEPVRAALAGIERRYEPLDVVTAIDAWAAGRLDVAAFWRVARRSRTHHEVTQVWWNDPTMPPEQARERSLALPGLVEALAAPSQEAMVLPRPLDGAPARLAFLRAAESLILAEQNPVVLSAPTYADCTLDFDDLLRRLRSAAGTPVGPLDLVQALHRMRPVDPARLCELDLGTMPTEPAFTHPHAAETWDAAYLVRTWVAGGGLPRLDPVADDGVWSTTAVAPVPWSRCAALPDQLREDPWCPGPMVETVRMMPLWGDRTMSHAYVFWFSYDPRHFPGRIAGHFGVPLHDRLLSLMTLDEYQQVPHALETLQDAARHGRLEPAAIVAAAVGRHGAGTLAVGRLTRSIQSLFESGGLRGFWPFALAIADARCDVASKPSGLPQLLRLLAAYAHEVPEPTIPSGLREFADSRGRSRSHVEARALVAALERAGQVLDPARGSK